MTTMQYNLESPDKKNSKVKNEKMTWWVQLTNLKFQESFQNIQEHRGISISIKIVSIFATKFFQLRLPRIFFLQERVCQVQSNIITGINK